MEQDTAATFEKDDKIYIDFNRSGIPLLQIDTHAKETHPNDTKLIIRELQEMLNSLDISDGSIKEGEMRVDVHIQVAGEKNEGPVVDIKNICSTRNIERAVQYEFERQVDLLKDGKIPEYETRKFNNETGKTQSIRSKGEEPDYRYFQDPDLPQITVSNERISAMYGILGELPFEVKRRFTNQFGMDVSDVKTVFRNPWSIEFFTRLVWTLQIDPKTVYKWVYEYVFHKCEKDSLNFEDVVTHTLGHQKLCELLEMVSHDKVTVDGGRLVMDKVIDGDARMPAVIAEDLGLVGQVVIGEDVKACTMRVLASRGDILDHCIKIDDELPLMKIVTQIMSDLNPNQRWRGDYRVGDPVCIKELVTEAFYKRKAEKAGQSSGDDR